MERENVHGIDAKVENILKRSDKMGDGIYHDHKLVVNYAVEEMIASLKLHISGQQLRAQRQRLLKEAEKKKNMYYWVKDAKEEKQKAKLLREKLTPFNCPSFLPQEFNKRVCARCGHDRSRHT